MANDTEDSKPSCSATASKRDRPVEGPPLFHPGRRLGSGVHLLNKSCLANSAHGKHDRGRHHFVVGIYKGWRTAACDNIGIAGRIDDTSGKDRLTHCFALKDHAFDLSILDNGRDKHAVQHRVNSRFLDQHISNLFECSGIKRVAD